MATKEEVKKQIDLLPEDLLDKVYDLLLGLLKQKPKKIKNWKSRSFKGRFDKKDIRREAYE
jgi:hypothetical protein